MLSSLLRLFEITWIKTNSVRGSAVKWETHILDVPILYSMSLLGIGVLGLMSICDSGVQMS